MSVGPDTFPGTAADIHDYNGQLALKAAGLLDEFHAIVIEGRQTMRLVEQDGSDALRSAAASRGRAP
ncbi:hypothetical protein [Streptomyces sp. CA2R101]|uniref:hypothetical protein n=1 Tax=Streptomyces sp. CA2R101 TaxID=3120152 RepID=UPI003FA70B2B